MNIPSKVKHWLIKANLARNGSSKPYYAATLWRESAIKVQRETQLYAYISDNVPPTKRAPTMGRDYNVVRFPGQAIDPNCPAQPIGAPQEKARPRKNCGQLVKRLAKG